MQVWDQQSRKIYKEFLGQAGRKIDVPAFCDFKVVYFVLGLGLDPSFL